jgi:hypothetical protein
MQSRIIVYLHCDTSLLIANFSYVALTLILFLFGLVCFYSSIVIFTGGLLLNNNELDGTIPTQLGTLNNLGKFSVHAE